LAATSATTTMPPPIELIRRRASQLRASAPRTAASSQLSGTGRVIRGAPAPGRQISIEDRTLMQQGARCAKARLREENPPRVAVPAIRDGNAIPLGNSRTPRVRPCLCCKVGGFPNCQGGSPTTARWKVRLLLSLPARPSRRRRSLRYEVDASSSVAGRSFEAARVASSGYAPPRLNDSPSRRNQCVARPIYGDPIANFRLSQVRLCSNMLLPRHC